MFYDEFIKLCNGIKKSPTAVAKEIGLAGAHVTKWKNGSNPTDSTKLKVCEYFNLPNDFFSDDQKEKAPTDEGERKIDDDDIKFALWGTREIDDDVLEQVKAFAKFARENRRDSEDN